MKGHQSLAESYEVCKVFAPKSSKASAIRNPSIHGVREILVQCFSKEKTKIL